MRVKLEVLVLLLLSFCVVACSGSGSGSTSFSNARDDSTTTTGSTLNPYVSGSLFYALDGRGGAARVDAATGEVDFLEGTLRWEDRYTGIVSARVEPTRFQRGEMVLTVKGCGDDLAGRITCIEILDASGAKIEGFRSEARSSQPAQLSRNGDYVALVVSNINLSEYFLDVYHRSGEFIDSRKLPDDFGFNWLPDGRILVTGVHEFYQTDPYQAELITVLPLPDALIGVIGSADVSPDGNKVAFSFVRRSETGSSTELIVLNLESGTLTPMLRSADVELAQIASPAWSPDGKWILVQVRSTSQIFAPGLSSFMYAVRSNLNEPINVDPYTDTPDTPSLVSLWHKMPNRPSAERWPRYTYYWQP